MRRTQMILGLLAAMVAAVGCDDQDRAKAEQSLPSSRSSAAASVAAATSASAAPQPPPRPRRPAQPLNVLLISVDAMRADMPWAGYERAIAPVMTQIAKESVVYEDVRAVASYTAQSVAAWLSGRFASTLYRAGWFFARYPDCNLFFPEILQDKGIRTIGVQSHMYFSRGKGFEQGFDVWELVPGITFDPETDKHVTSEKTTALFRELLTKPENTSGQFFAWTHYTDPHDVYIRHAECPKEWGKKNRDRYDCEIFHADRSIGELLSWAKQQPWWDRTALIITSDHGEAFGEHGQYRHAFDLWDVLIRVPLMLRVPGAEPKRIRERRSQIDLAPTILDLMGQQAPDDFMGESLVPDVFGEEPETRDVIVAQLTEDSHNPPRRAIVKGDYKLTVYGRHNGWRHMLFNLKDDPGEKNDLGKKEPEKLEEMKQLLFDTFAKIPRIEPFGGNKLKGGGTARGPVCPPKKNDKKQKKQ